MSARVALHRVIGVDPGPVPGLVALDYDTYGALVATRVVQCSANAAAEVLRGLVLNGPQGAAPLVQIERFVNGPRAARSSTASAGATTRQMVELLEAEARESDAAVVLRSASETKPWATDARLEAAGLLEATKGMRHARDAARHALFAASKYAGVSDPLSWAAR